MPDDSITRRPIRGAAASPVPTIDISPFRDGPPDARQAVVDAVRQGCEEIGFLVITGHGVPQDAIDDLYAASVAFYDLPDDEKMKVASPWGDPFHAYAGVDRPSAGYDQEKPDLREFFHANRYDTPAEAIANGYPPEVAVTSPPNLWPGEPPSFEPACKAYYRHMEELCDQMLRIFAVALDLDEHWFEDKTDHHLSNLSLNHYPGQADPPLEGQLRASAHVDFSTLTVLYQDDAPGGLQVHQRGVGWIDIPCLPASYVVNIGDFLARWTNGRWKATPHRVVNPPREVATSRRISIPFFHLPNQDAVIDPVPSCIDAEHPRRWPSIVSGDWIELRRRGRAPKYDQVPA